MRKAYTFVALCMLSATVFGQAEISAFSATGSGYSTASLTDYQCLGVNPANLGWKKNKHTTSLGFLEAGASIFAEPLTKKEAIADLFNNEKNLTYAERVTAAEQFNGTRLMAQMGTTWVGFAYQDEKFGGIAFSLRERFNWNTKFNINVSNFMFLGFHDPYFDSLSVVNGDTIGYSTQPVAASEVYKGSELRFIWYREYNLGYGRSFYKNKNINLYAGVNFKYLTGYGSFEYTQKDGNLQAYSALSPIFGVDYDTPTPSAIEGKGLKKTGTGFGVDLGFTADLYEKVRIAVAINDIGSINWDGNVYEGNETKVWKIETGGINNYNIFEQGELIQTDNAPDDEGEWEGLESKRVSLPTNLRAGAVYKINTEFEAGADLYMPMGDMVPGAYEAALFGLGFKYTPAKWVKLSLGMVNGGKMGTSIPFGVSFFPFKSDASTWEIGFGLRDVASAFMKTDSPNVGLSFGLLRFSFGQEPK